MTTPSVNRSLSTDDAHDQDDESAAARRASYSAHITAVCNAMNAETSAMIPLSEPSKSDQRRETNRQSARRSRKRRRDEIQELEKELRRLSSETEELTVEKRRLQQELQTERSSALSAPSSAPNNYFERVAQTTFHEQYAQALVQQHLQSSLSSNLALSGLLPYIAQLQGAAFSQAQSAPSVLDSLGLQICPTANSAQFGSSLLQSQSLVELALLQDHFAKQARYQSAAPLPLESFGLQSGMANLACLSILQQARANDGINGLGGLLSPPAPLDDSAMSARNVAANIVYSAEYQEMLRNQGDPRYQN